jgi:hypothetical protein
VGTLNLGALLFAMLLVVWIGYALPRTAARRELMGQAREVEKSRDSQTARVLSSANRSRPAAREVSSMPEDRLLLRPADPTRRPRFDDAPGQRMGHLPTPESPDASRRRAVGPSADEGSRTAEPSRAARRNTVLLRSVLAALATLTVVIAVLAGLSVLPAWAVILPVAALAAYLAGLRRTELERRRLTHAASERADTAAEHHTRARRASVTAPSTPAAEARTTSTASTVKDEARDRATTPAPAGAAPATAAESPEDEGTALGRKIEDAAEDVVAPGSWIPRPVPRPTYTLHGEVEDLASRHAEHRRSVAARPVPLETEEDGADEALVEEAVPAVVHPDLGLDEILRRRRA